MKKPDTVRLFLLLISGIPSENSPGLAMTIQNEHCFIGIFDDKSAVTVSQF